MKEKKRHFCEDGVTDQDVEDFWEAVQEIADEAGLTVPELLEMHSKPMPGQQAGGWQA